MNKKVINKYITSNSIMYFSVILISIIAFILIYGYHILNPTYTDWLLSGGDLSQHYLGWKAYRMSDWSFPLGYMNQLSYPYEASVIFTDSIPIFAVLFKLFRAFLPTEFQYFGLWGILCFVLQGVFSCKILSRFTDKKYLAVFGSIFFIIAPVMLMRMYMHTALAAHWLLLWCFDRILSYKSEKNSKMQYISWGLIGALCSVIHIYLLFICGLLLCVYVLLDMVYTRKIIRNIAMIGVFCVPAAILIYIFGGFSSGMKAASGGLGFFSMNLNAFYNPQGWSSILPDWELINWGQMEGFAYLGAGMLLMVFVALITLLYKWKQIGFWKKNKKNVIVTFIGTIVILFISAAPIITFNKHYYWIKFPDKITEIWSIFRSSGRCAWILVYGIMIISFYFILRFTKKQIAIGVVLCTLGIQIYDLHDILLAKRETFGEVVSYEPALMNDEIWDKIDSLDEIEHIYFMPSFSAFSQDEGYAITNWALDTGKTVNSFYFARSIDDKVAQNLESVLEEPGKSDLFIIPEEQKNTYMGYDLNYYEIDGYIVGYARKLD